MMSSSSVSAPDCFDPFPGRTNIQLVTPTDHHHDHGGHYCHNWVSHHTYHLDAHHEQQAARLSDDGFKHDNMDIQKGIGAWIWEQKDDHHVPTIIGDGFDSTTDDIHENWPVPSKLRVVRKMNPKRASTANPVPVVENTDDSFPYFAPENDSTSNNSGTNNNGIRVCSDCNTTKTPLWRSGPRGPKSLCNACGIRQRKARRALAAASEAAATVISDNTVTKATSSPKSLKIKISKSKEKTSNNSKQGGQQLYKKRLKLAESTSYTYASQDSNPSGADDQDSKKLCFEEFMTVSLSKNVALHRVFPQDEKEAAILLMALSCGLVHN
ncbi:hypothetical protein QQ045_026607 [Rhodiola kirilowii]